MLWILPALLTALFESLKDVFSKRGLAIFDEYIISASLIIFGIPFILPLLFFIEIPELGEKFWLALIAGGTLNFIAIILYIKAIKCSDLSVTVPLVNFTPLFLLITSPLLVGEYPESSGYIGIILIVTGSYILNTGGSEKGFFAPIRSVLFQKGPRLMLLVAFIWSFTANIDKIGVVNSSPVIWAFSIYLFLGLALVTVVFIKVPERVKEVPKNLKVLFPVGFFSAITIIMQMIAINMTLVAYVISIKRLSSALSVIFGHFIFREKGFKERIIGVLIMISGVLFIAL